LGKLIREVLARIEPEIRHSGVQLELVVPDDLPTLSADQFQIEQVVLNLVRNALEAMTDTAPEVRQLVIRINQSRPDMIEVAVVDRGRGINREAEARMFDPFFSTKPLGLGMGLPISRSILEWHGGQIWSDRKTDCGACFRFTLPITHGEASDVDDG
jgi:signal transduction histidine kinase